MTRPGVSPAGPVTVPQAEAAAGPCLGRRLRVGRGAGGRPGSDNHDDSGMIMMRPGGGAARDAGLLVVISQCPQSSTESLMMIRLASPDSESLRPWLVTRGFQLRLTEFVTDHY